MCDRHNASIEKSQVCMNTKVRQINPV